MVQTTKLIYVITEQHGFHKAISLLKHVKTEILIVFLFLFLLSITTYKFSARADSLLASGTGFTLYFEDSALTFQHYSNVEFDCVTGIWNATNGTLSLYNDKGALSFIPVDNCTLNIGTDSDRELQVTASNTALSESEGNYTSTILSGARVTLSWRFLPWSMIDNYFMLGVGLTGIIMMIAGPTIFARTFVKHGLDTESVEWLGYAMLMMVMGFGFLVVWLWPG